jgi:hypothetical protein
MRFGRLVAQWPAGRGPSYKVHWLCLCDCGNLKVVAIVNLLHSTRSCGCISKEKPTNLKHGHSRKRGNTREYTSWLSMRSRCYYVGDKEYLRYGGVGITVCDRWKNSFPNFLSDMGPRPLGKTLDRFPDKNGNYEPGNCRWATPQEQSANMRKFRHSTGAATRLKQSEVRKKWWADKRAIQDLR